MSKLHLRALGAVLLLQAGAAVAVDTEIEEVVIVGTQIKGAQISDALPVTVITEADIEALGVNSGDELLEYMAEQGQNFFSESENISGGVNSARGDIGAFNLRNLGTGNTLVLLNGRRMVNSAAYQTEAVGGSFVPVNSVNVQSLPVTGLRRAEVLKDGASAIYGADAVAGVVNYVLKDDFEGLRISFRYDDYDNVPRNDERFTVEWGSAFNEGKTNVGAFLNYFSRDRVNSQDDPRWANSDFRSRTPAPFNDNTTFRNNSINSNFGQYDIRSSVSSLNIPSTVVDSRGEFVTYPTGNANCVFAINAEVCGADDTQGNFRYNLNDNRDLYSELERVNFFSYATHEVSDTLEAFGEFSWYYSDTNTTRHPSAPLSAVAKFRIAPDAFYNPFGPCGSANRLPDSVIGTDVPCSGLELEVDNYRFAQAPRVVDVEGDTFRIVGGLRGNWGDWDWEGALSWSRAEREDVTSNRVSNTLITAALNDTTAAGFNPFSATLASSNLQQALIDVTRENEQELTMIDFKMSKADIYQLPAGPVGMVVGLEYRDESFDDDRDPRLDGTIQFTDNSGNGFPFVSDVVNSSPTSDSSGDRQVTSVFGELQVPVLDNLDLQLALRYEDFSDVGDTTVGKIAFGYRFVEQILFRGSWSEAYRVPNLVTINEAQVARSNTRDDFVCLFVDPDEATLDCTYGIQRTAQGSRNLEPEQSNNTSFGIVLDPIENLTITVDVWEIEKEDTIGLFGEENHIALELLGLINAGNGSCGTTVGNTAVVRDATSIDPANQALYDTAGICYQGDVARVDDQYANLDTRTIKGHDIGVYYDIDTKWGRFDFRYVGTFLDVYEQEAGGAAAELVAAKASGVLPASVPVVGFASLKSINGNPERKDTVRLDWTYGDWKVAATSLHYDGFTQNLSDGRAFPIDSMTTYNMNVAYKFSILDDVDSRVRLGINNLTDERAPFADDSFGYFADQHRDLGRYYYLDFQFKVI
ncbi:MAG: outer membrane receptor protein involved in Fe transport [Candidatus Azotimanducaceae bacterium]|jgi:outer membrane receptor protein involved in Fe transport